MHEASIALGLVEAVSEEAVRLKVERVVAVHVRIGALSGVVKDALLFAWDVAATGSRAEGSRLVIEEVPLVIFCARCKAEQVVEGNPVLQCPSCGYPAGEIRRGRELDLIGMEVPDGSPLC